MKIKTFKNISDYNKSRFISELKERGYTVSRIDNGYLLSSSSFNKIFSTWGLIFIVKEIKLIPQDQKIMTHIAFNIAALVLLYLCAFIAYIAMILSEPNYDQSKIFLTFLLLLLVASLTLFTILRSDIINDIKKAMKKATISSRV